MSRPREGVSEVAEGVFAISRAAVNCYLVITSDGPVLIDAGLPRSWRLLEQALAACGLTADELLSVYLTHGHFDHVGMGERLIDEHHTPVHVHRKDVPLAQHPYRYDHESPRRVYPFRHPRAVPGLVRMAAAGALGIRGIDAHGDVVPGAPVLGGLIPVASPGHTYGHCAYLMPDRGILFSGDALVTYDPYTAATGPRAVARAATADSAAALIALPALADTDARLVLPGHGDPVTDGVRPAVRAALAAGVG